MKKKLALLLALAMLLTCFAACGKQDTDTSEGGSGSETSGTGDVSETSCEPVVIEYETVVSVGKTYTLTPTPDTKYPDTYGMELCDGLYATTAGYSDDRFCGISGSSIRVVFDMGDDYKQIYKFGVSYLSSSDAGIRPISTARVYYSMDQESWTRSEFFVRPEQKEESTLEIAWLTLETPVDAKYIRFDIRGPGGWLFLDECIVIANTPGNAATAKYLQELEAAYGTHKIAENALVKGTDEVDRENASPINAAKNQSYTTNYQPGTGFPDDADQKFLTDGAETGQSFENGGYVGYVDGHMLTIDIPLGTTVKGLADFELAMYQQANMSYLLPYYVDIFVSSDGAIFQQVDRVYAPDDTNVTFFTFASHLEKGVTAKAVRFVLAETASKCFLIEEASAFYYGTDAERSLYPDVVLPEVTEELYWPKDSADYSKKINLAEGLPYQLEAGISMLYKDESASNTAPEKGVLTDGKYSPNTTYNNGYWNQTHGGGSRSVYFDLGYNSAITGFKINYLNLRDYGISVPSQATMFLSVDGKEWYSAGVAEASAGTAVCAVPAEAKLKKPVEARFVKIVFPVSPHTYVDEIEILGTKKITSDAIKVTECGTPAAMNEYLAPSEEILGGVHDLMLIYYTIESMTTDEDYFLPYVAYLEKSKDDPEKYEIKDTMFDGYLFLPSVAGLPSGGMPYASEEKPNYWTDWTYLYEECFKEGINFDALDKTCAKVKEALSLPDDYKLKVFVTIPYVNKKATNFGDVDGDGVSEDLSKPEDIRKVIGIYADLYLNKFAEMQYQNISLDGFYWFEEAIAFDEDPDNISATAEVLKGKGTQLFWIPYYCATGYSTWNNYGFTAACMQPNYVFKTDRPLSQLKQAAEIVRQYGMGIEIEINSSALNSQVFFSRYMEYLGYGINYGYMTNCIHMYYQDGSTFRSACYSGSLLARTVYDTTYKFIKGTLEGPAPLDAVSVTCKKAEYASGKLFANEDGMLRAKLVKSASHGSISVAPNGSYLYVPYDGYTGSDSFTFTYSNYLGWSEEITVNVTVE